MIAGFLMTGGVLFWVLTVLALLTILCEVNFHKPFWSFLTLGFYFGMLFLFGNFNAFSYIYHNLWVLPVYFSIGAIWGLFKWYMYVLEWADDYKSRRTIFLKSRGVVSCEDVPEEYRLEWVEAQRYMKHKPSGRNEKSRITSWMCFWIFSMLWDMFGKPWKYIYNLLSGVFDRISNAVSKRIGYDEDNKPKR